MSLLHNKDIQSLLLNKEMSLLLNKKMSLLLEIGKTATKDF